MMNGHLILDTPIAVDFWNIRKCPSTSLFFLSHIHSDHTVGLTSSWSRPIYCSKVTSELLCQKISLPDDLIRPLELNSPTLIPMNTSHTEMLTVTAFDANHCPGAVMFLFQGYFGTILYTGDFRYTPEMFINSPLGNIFVDVLYLDNTYCDPLCEFGSRDETKKKIFEIIRSYPEHDILFGMQALGKPDLLIAVAMNFEEYIAVPISMYKFLEILEVPNVFQVDTPEHECRLRVVPSYYISKKLFRNLTRPTIVILVTALYEGLEGAPYSNQDSVYVVPYSDHSSYSELQNFVKRIQPGRIIPIVGTQAKGPFNISFAKRANMSCFDQFLSKRSNTPVTIPADLDFGEARSMCHSNVTLSIKKKQRSSIGMMGTKSVKSKGVIFESPPRKSWNNKNVQRSVPENQDDNFDPSRSHPREAIDLNTTIPIRIDFLQAKEKSTVSGGESETTTNLAKNSIRNSMEVHLHRPSKKWKSISDLKLSHSNGTLNPETCTRANIPDSHSHLDSRTNKPNLDPDSDTNESSFSSNSCSDENTPKTSERANIEIVKNKIIAENHSDLSFMPGGSKSKRDCHVQEKASGQHPFLKKVQKSTGSSEKEDASSVDSCEKSIVYNIDPNFPIVTSKNNISIQPEMLRRKRKLPAMFHEEFHSLQKRKCQDYFTTNTRRKQERMQNGLADLEAENEINTEVRDETNLDLSAGHLPTLSLIDKTCPVRNSVFTISISDYVGRFDIPAWTFVSCESIFSNFVKKQRLRYKPETSALSSKVS